MNLVFHKKTLQVLSVFDNKFNFDVKTEEDTLKKMFPNNFADLSIWRVDQKISRNLIHLKIKLDENGCPNSLLHRGKEIYVISEEEKKKMNEQKRQGKSLISADGIVFRKEFVDFLIKSPYTKQETAKNLLNGLIPYRHAIPVIWRGFFKLSTGYSSIGRNILLRLHNYGIFAKPEYLISHSDIDPIYLSYLSKYETLKFSRRCNNQTKVLSHTPLPDDFSGKKIIFTMMETETLHPDFVNLCNQYNEVWVPCKHNRTLFVNHGVRAPVHVIPLGVDERFYFGDNTSNVDITNGLLPLLGSGLKKFKFMSLFQWYSRKCPDILIKSFVKSFTDKDDVCLIVVNHYGDPAQIFAAVQNYAKSIKKSNYPSIFLYNQIPSDKQLPSVYKFCDAFISTSRGEGFSLPPIEAAACGLPIISAYHTAMKDYLSNDNAYLVKPIEREVCPPELAAACGWYGGQIFNKLGDNDIQQFSIHMKSVVDNYAVALKKAEKLQNIVRNNYTWDATASLVAQRIREG